MGIWIGGLCSHSRLARLGRLDEQWKTCCPCCLANVPETLSRLLCECTQWNSKRLGICRSMARLLAKIPALDRGISYSLLGERLLATNSLEENASATVEMQEKKASDEAIFIDGGRLVSFLIRLVVTLCLVSHKSWTVDRRSVGIRLAYQDLFW